MQNQSKAILLAKTSHMTYSRKSEGIIFALHRNATLKFVYDSASCLSDVSTSLWVWQKVYKGERMMRRHRQDSCDVEFFCK